ncbi:MAG: type II secretion system protein GspG [Candidatus Levybacteria bacterium]|nr:type II secretion system protein GspG [Candidatus Levybacteria bacterium]
MKFELLIVISVIAILAFGVFWVFDPLGQLQSANDAKRKSDLAKVQQALEQYYKDNGSYPLSTGLDKEKPYRIKGFKADHQIIDWGEDWLPYMAILPKDPKSIKRYLYVEGGNGQSYKLYASLERGGSDPMACRPGGSACFGVPPGITCGAAADICNYGVSSRNVSP